MRIDSKIFSSKRYNTGYYFKGSYYIITIIERHFDRKFLCWNLKDKYCVRQSVSSILNKTFDWEYELKAVIDAESRRQRDLAQLVCDNLEHGSVKWEDVKCTEIYE